MRMQTTSAGNTAGSLTKQRTPMTSMPAAAGRAVANTRALLVGIGLALAAGGAVAEVNRCDDALKPICGKMDELIQPSNVLGASIALMGRDGKPAFATFNKTPEGEPITPQMRFEIGSISKTFTAARIMQLIEQGAFTLDTAIAEIVPSTEIAYSDKVPGNLTIRNLLAMTSGLYDYVHAYRVIGKDLSAFWPMRRMTSSGYFPDEYQPKVGELCYGSTNTLLLGLVIDRQNGGNGLGKEPLLKSLRQGLLAPAELTNTFMGGYEGVYPISSCTNVNYFDTERNVPPKRCANPESFLYTGDGKAPNDSKTAYLSFAGPAGGMISTAGDMASWFHWLFTKGPGNQMVKETGLIGERQGDADPPITWSKCNQSPWPYGDPKLRRLEYGFTMEIATYQYGAKPVKVYGFLGGSLTFNSYVLYLPEYGVSAAILLNNFNNFTDTFKYMTTLQLGQLTTTIVEQVIAGKGSEPAPPRGAKHRAQ